MAATPLPRPLSLPPNEATTRSAPRHSPTTPPLHHHSHNIPDRVRHRIRLRTTEPYVLGAAAHCVGPHTTLRASTLVGGRWRWRWPDGDGLMAVDDDGILGLVRGDDGPQGVSARTGSHTHTTVSRSCVDTPTHRRTLGTAAFASSTTQHNTTQHNTTQRDAALVISITAAAAAAVSLLLELMHEQWFAARKTCLLLVAVCPHTYRT